MISSVVLSNGTLNDRKILKKEPLYQGMNGRFVERFYVTPTQSYIFKPLTNISQLGKEVWLHEHVLTDFPAVFPKIMAHSNSDDPTTSWMIFEDLGPIQHVFNEKLGLGMTKLIADWHSLSNPKLMNISLKGPKPYIEEIVSSILSNKDMIMKTEWGCDIPLSLFECVFFMLGCHTFSEKKVISHGDLHLGNYGYAGSKIIVLDWEHIHLNSPYWDLYHLLDISHPVFPKNITKHIRKLALQKYLEESNFSKDPADREAFYQGYYLFSAAFSIWMLLLIKTDLEREEAKWSREQLDQQLVETVASFLQCAEELESLNYEEFKVVLK